MASPAITPVVALVGSPLTSSTVATTPRAGRSRKLDRKSTRLNSSHLGISYAVFCLKKKIASIVARDMTKAGKRGLQRTFNAASTHASDKRRAWERLVAMSTVVIGKKS